MDPLTPPRLDAFEVRRALEGPRLILYIHGELDLASAPQLSAGLESSLAELDGVTAVVLDLKGVSFVDSTGVHAVIGVQRRVEASARDFALRHLGPQAQRIFELVGLLDRVTVEGSPPAAEPPAG